MLILAQPLTGLSPILAFAHHFSSNPVEKREGWIGEGGQSFLELTLR